MASWILNLWVYVFYQIWQMSTHYFFEKSFSASHLLKLQWYEAPFIDFSVNFLTLPQIGYLVLLCFKFTGYISVISTLQLSPYSDNFFLTISVIVFFPSIISICSLFITSVSLLIFSFFCFKRIYNCLLNHMIVALTSLSDNSDIWFILVLACVDSFFSFKL